VSDIKQGWQCPKCKRILSPFLNECFCHIEDKYVAPKEVIYKQEKEDYISPIIMIYGVNI